MLTVKAIVLKHNEKMDGTFNVKIRVTHDRVSRYLETNFYVSKKQLNKKLEIKDNIVLAQIDRTLMEYRISVGELGYRVNLMTCDQVVDYLQNANKEIDFIEFGKAHINRLLAENRKGTSINFRAVVNSLIDYFGREKIFISEITSNMLLKYEAYLRKERVLTRQSRGNKPFTIKSPGLSDSGLHNHMRDLRGLFNVARDHFNDEDLGVIRIQHYPFKKYKLIRLPETPKKNLDIESVVKIRDLKCNEGTRMELARDMFMLSLYMCGTNSVDFYNMDCRSIKNGRLEYNRSKTKGKRRDGAFISLKIIDEAKPLLDKYLGKLQKRFSSRIGLSSAISYGMRKIQKLLNLPSVTYYWARSIFASWARNRCRKSKDDVAMALNHVDENRKTTDIYIDKDWTIIDEVQEAVVALLPRPEILKKMNHNVEFLMHSVNLKPLQ